MNGVRIGIGVHSPITALLAEEAGANVLWLGSLEMSTSRGVPDREVMTPAEIAAIIRGIRAVTALPIYVDADTGYGSEELAVLATRLYEEAGADAICIEDNVFPKNNSLDDRVTDRLLTDADVFATRISAMVAARRSIQVIARTEALVAGLGPDVATSRLLGYAEAGADALFAQANRASAEHLLTVVKEIAPVRPMVLAPTVLPGMVADGFAAYGSVTVLFANVVIRSVVAQTSRVLRRLLASRSLESVSSDLASVERLFELCERTAPTGAASTSAAPAVPAPRSGAPRSGTPRWLGAEQARVAMTEAAFDYCVGGAGDEAGVRRNVERLDDLTLTPRVLRDVSRRDTTVDLFGSRLAAPLLVAPMGLQALCHPDAETATAAAATSLSLGFCLSTFSSRPVEEVAAAGPGCLWQQVYLLRDRDISRSLVARAERAGARALVCTVDVPVVGNRGRDARNGFRRFEVAPPALVGDPCFADLLARRRAADPTVTAARLVGELFPDPSLSWADLADLRSSTALPIVVKGILHPDDAARAVDVGADAVVVSTHGGRQGDRHIAAVDALPPVVAVVGDRIPVLFDSGIRRGSHIAVALALGASAVLVGRPVLWGLAAAGRAGVEQVLGSLVDEFGDALALLGAGTVDDLSQDLVSQRVPS